MRAWVALLFCTTILAFLPVSAVTAAESAENYPSKPIRVLIGYTPGGGVDITARNLGRVLSDHLKQPIVIDNRPGAQSDVAAEIVSRSTPDGYTLTVMTTSFAVNAATKKGQKFNAVKDFQPISMIAENPNLVIVNPGVPANTLKELIAYAKANPGKLNVGYTGSTQELFGREFAKHAGIKVLHVPYRGASNMATALLSNEVQLCFFSTTSSGHFVREGRMRALALAADQRSDALPDVPTTAEAGLPTFKASTWYGMLGPSGIPRHIVDTLNAAVRRALGSSQFKASLSRNGQLAIPTTPEEFHEKLKQEIQRFKGAM